MESPEGMELPVGFEAPDSTPADGDLALVRRCRAGDASALRTLYETHHAFVFHIARRLGTPPEETEDVVHEVFMVVLRSLDRFEGGKLTTWMYRITANAVSYAHRKRRRRRALAELCTRVGLPSPVDPESLASAASDARAVDRILEQMSPKRREVFALFELEGSSGEEIAERVGCPINTVWSRLRRGRAEFLRIGRRLGVLEGSP